MIPKLSIRLRWFPSPLSRQLSDTKQFMTLCLPLQISKGFSKGWSCVYAMCVVLSHDAVNATVRASFSRSASSRFLRHPMLSNSPIRQSQNRICLWFIYRDWWQAYTLHIEEMSHLYSYSFFGSFDFSTATRREERRRWLRVYLQASTCVSVWDLGYSDIGLLIIRCEPNHVRGTDAYDLYLLGYCFPRSILGYPNA